MDEPCLNAETLAEYGDGKLTPAERRAVEKHLADCEDCFELFAGSAAFRSEEAAEQHPIAEVRQLRPAPHRWWLPAAAAAVLAAGVWVMVGGRTERAATLAWAERLGGPSELQAAAAEAWSGGGGGLSFGGGLPARKKAFRLGVHLLDARVALAARDDQHFGTSLEQVAELVPPKSEASRLIDELHTTDSALRGSATREKVLAKLTGLTRAGTPDAFDFGAWAEAGRLAASGGRTGFLESDVAGQLETTARAAGTDPVVTKEIATIHGALADGKVSTEELSALERSFRQLILLN